ncbi:MAG: CpaF family protein [Micrococcales bacterium]
MEPLALEPVLAQLLRLVGEPGVTDVLLNGPSQVWVDRGAGLQDSQAFQLSGELLLELGFSLAQLADRHVDLANPMGDFVLGSRQLPPLAQLGVESLRVHVVLESAVSPVTLLSVRVHRVGGLPLATLAESGFCTGSQLRELQVLASGGANFLISGAAGCGKTTLLRAMLQQTPALRTVIIEDSAELVPAAGHLLGLQTRQANTEGRGEIGAAQLLRQALRMRPDRLVVGEIRGDEVSVLMQALNTGHLGSAATIHANSAVSVPSRLLGLALQAGVPESVFWLTAPQAFHWVIQLERVDGKRRVQGIHAWAELAS